MENDNNYCIYSKITISNYCSETEFHSAIFGTCSSSKQGRFSGVFLCLHLNESMWVTNGSALFVMGGTEQHKAIPQHFPSVSSRNSSLKHKAPFSSIFWGVFFGGGFVFCFLVCLMLDDINTSELNNNY